MIPFGPDIALPRGVRRPAGFDHVTWHSFAPATFDVGRIRLDDEGDLELWVYSVDVNFGDPIWPAPAHTEVPRLLGGVVELMGYPDHMVLAEKIVTAVERGTANTRWRDLVDIAALMRAGTSASPTWLPQSAR